MPDAICPSCQAKHSCSAEKWAKLSGVTVECRQCHTGFVPRPAEPHFPESLFTEDPPARASTTSPPPLPAPAAKSPTKATPHFVPDRSGLRSQVQGMRDRMRFLKWIGPVLLAVSLSPLLLPDGDGKPLTVIIAPLAVAAWILASPFARMLQRQAERIEIEMHNEELLVAIANNTART